MGLVDRLDPVLVLLAREVKIELAVQVAEERLGLVPVGVYVQAATIAPVQRAEMKNRPRAGDELELVVESLAHGGAGVARADGYVVFVRGAVPGDRVRARITKSKRSFGEADPVELLEPSPERVEPAASRRALAGAALRASARGEERQVADALSRIGRFDDPPVETIVPAVEPLRYRNKVEYSFGEDEEGELVLGFHRPGRWDQIDDVEQDILASERVDELRRAVRAWAATEGLNAYDRREHTGLLRNLVVREGRRTGALQARLVTGPGALRMDDLAEAVPVDSLLWTRAAGVAETTREGETEVIRGDEAIEEEPRACASASRRTPSSRPTPRWPSASTRGRSIWPASAGASWCSTSTAASARSGWCWPSTPRRLRR